MDDLVVDGPQYSDWKEEDEGDGEEEEGETGVAACQSVVVQLAVALTQEKVYDQVE